MNYIELDRCSVNNGTGIRCVLFVSGCEHKCVGCQNKDSWSYTCGKPFTNKEKQYIINYMKSNLVDGITFSGGDPLAPNNRKDVLEFASVLKNMFGNTKTIWLYTGYKYEELSINDLVDIDVLVDGKFDISKRDVTLAFRGSSNQRIIDVQKSLKENKVVLYEVK